MHRRSPWVVIVSLLLAGLAQGVSAAELVGPDIWFPVERNANVHWSDTFGDPRSGGRTHKGVDIIAPQMTPIYAAEAGYIGAAWGGDSPDCMEAFDCAEYALLIYGESGWSTFYMHINSDTPGRPNGCDAKGSPSNAFSPRLADILASRGTLEPQPSRSDPQDVVYVDRGELIAYVGSSGNAGCGNDHLHFEVWEGHNFLGADDSSKSNPTPYVDEAIQAGRSWGPDGPAPMASMGRAFGSTRIGTAVALSQIGFDQADVAFIAPADQHVEALVAAPLAGLRAAPVLLAWSSPQPDRPMLDDEVLHELRRLGVSEVVLVGSTDRLDPGIEQELEDELGLAAEQISRFGQADPWRLSRAIAEEILALRGWDPDDPDPDAEPLSALVALGIHPEASRAWPDAVSAASLAAWEGVPILLVKPDVLPNQIAELLDNPGIGDIRIVGGPAAVSADVEAAIQEAGHETARLAGSNRIETSIAVADELIASGATAELVWVATSRNYPDALTAAGTVSIYGSILFLVDGTSDAAGAVDEWITRRGGEVQEVFAVGGAAVVTPDVLQRLAMTAGAAGSG